MKSWLIGPCTLGLAMAVVSVLVLLPAGTRAVGDYSRTASYEDQILVRCPDRNKATVQVLMAHSDVWNLGKDNVDLRIKSSAFARVQRFFPECNVIVSNLEAHVQEAESLMFPMRKADEQAWMAAVAQEAFPKDLAKCESEMQAWERAFQESKAWFEEYHDYDAIKNWYKNKAEANSNIMTYVPSIGSTHEGREMPAILLTASTDPNRKKVYMQCQIHAREWVTGSTCMYIIDYLVKGYGKMNRVTNILDNIELVAVPFVNPDGYVYTWQHDRLWRKNRNKYSGAPCTGVDINRNFPWGFKSKPLSDACAEDYPGPKPLSELETEHIINFFRQHAPIVGAIDWHSYGQLILRPWGYTNATAPDDAWLKRLSTEMANIIKQTKGSEYTPERSTDLYPCYGIGADWLYSDDAAKTNKGVRPASFCIELRDKSGFYGFVLPAEQILPTAEEVLPAFLYFIEQTVAHPITYIPKTSIEDLFARFLANE